MEGDGRFCFCCYRGTPTLRASVCSVHEKVSQPMLRPLSSGGGPSVAATFDRFRIKLLAGVQDPQLRRYGFLLMAAGAGLLPLMAGSAQAALTKMPTDGADTLRV